MAFKTGNANGYKELLIAIKGMLTAAKMAYNCVAGVGNTGNGYVSAERASTAPVDETWTLTATSATNFTVTGSVSGAQAAATVGTAYDNGIVAFTIVAGSTPFVATDAFTFDVADGLGTVEKWTAEDWDTNYDADNGYELVLKGPGTSGADEIFVAINTVYSAGNDYYNWRLAGMTSFTPGVALQYQPGLTQGRLPRMLLWNQQITYWCAANGRRFIVVAKVSTVYQSLYLGFSLPTGLPTQFPYPLVVGGAACPSSTAANNRYSSTASDHRAFPSPYADAAAVIPTTAFDAESHQATLKVLSGSAWVKVQNIYVSSIQTTNIVWPWSSSVSSSYQPHQFSNLLRENIDGSYPHFDALVMLSNPVKNAFGFLQGITAVPGFGALAPEDTFTIGADTYIAFPTVPNPARNEFFALKME